MDCSFTEMNLVEYKSHVKTISPPLILDCARSYPHIFLSGSLECDSIYLPKENRSPLFVNHPVNCRFFWFSHVINGKFLLLPDEILIGIFVYIYIHQREK